MKVLLTALCACACLPAFGAQVVPAPKQILIESEEPIAISALHLAEPSWKPQAQALAWALQKIGGQELSWAKAAGPGRLSLARIPGMRKGGYVITGDGGSLTLSASDSAGIAFGAATLLQTAVLNNGQSTWRPMSIRDQPDFAYRSFMVDMGRNPHPPKLLRQVVDMLWYYKVGHLHLHLTDDQIISWPSKAFPKLQSANAGWTWQDFEDLEAYSQARGVTIIPEIDVPGHSTLLRQKYPEVFGATPTDLASSAKAQQGVQILIEEFLTVFPSTPYVHVGGDEAYGVPQEIQRDFLIRLNAFVRSKGKTMVVWEGPALGQGKNKVPTDVLQIGWRTIDFPAHEMLDAGYRVVNAAWDPMYIVDHYPRTMFTMVDLERCYTWNPKRFAHVNHDLETFAKPHITQTDRGIEGFCMPYWEGRPENLLPLCLPRLAAVSAGAWNRRGEQDFEAYLTRYQKSLGRLQAIAGFQLNQTPFADAETQAHNLAFRAKVRASSGNHQPPFGPDRLTNGIPDRFDHFLGFPTQPTPLEITIELPKPANVSRVVVFETAVGKSHELYELLVSNDGQDFTPVGQTSPESRGENPFVEHTFDSRRVSHLRIRTQGCHGLTFPSFSRLTEVMAFAE